MFVGKKAGCDDGKERKQNRHHQAVNAAEDRHADGQLIEKG